MEYLTTSKNLIETEKIGKLIASNIKPNFVIGLIGDLGAGKTTLVKNIYKSLSTDKTINVTSPTFTIVNKYPADMPFYHIDLYRLHSLYDFQTIGFEDYIDHNGVCFIEWVDNIDANIKRDLDISLTITENHERLIKFIAYTKKGREILFIVAQGTAPLKGRCPTAD